MRSYDYYGKDDPQNIDTLKSQINLYNSLELPATYMPEYDCLVKPGYVEALKAGMKQSDEIGLWFEITGELCRDAGVKWRSTRDRSWDFYVCPGFIMSYSTEEKHRLIDTAMRKVYDIFGVYPQCAGAWLLDSETMAYMNAHYDMKAYVICREQWGMDGYTLWGGPYFGGYYPSRNNMLTPAGCKDNQLSVPVFRMYISDPIYSYYEFGGKELNGIDYHLFTQEPVWRCGQDPEWVKWMFDSLFSDRNDSFACYQLGQETGFGFGDELRTGLMMQCKYALEHRKRYGLEFITLSQTGERFIEKFDSTPDNFTYIESDWAEQGKKSVWFNNRRYRINLFGDSNSVRIRDLQLFDDSYTERFLNQPCRSEWAIYDNLPVVDGVRFTPGCDEKNIPFDNKWDGRKYGTPAGMYFDGSRITGADGGTHRVELDNGRISAVFKSDSIMFKSNCGDFHLTFEYADNLPYITSIQENKIVYGHRGFEYCLALKHGTISGKMIASENGSMEFEFEMIR